MSTALPRTLSVLLVEDSPADGRLLIEALKSAIAAGDVIVQTVKNLALAVDALKTYDFSCVLLDLGLPDGRGVDSVRALREIDRKTAIIVLTGIADEKLAAEALTQGAQDYLVKGESDGEQLLKQLRRAVQRNRQTYTLETRRDNAFFQASHDAITLLPNMALFADRARQQMASTPAFALAYLALRGADALREKRGELRVDELLKTLTERWGENLRPADTLARVASDAFALLRQPASSDEDWSHLIDDCQRQFEAVQGPDADHSGLRLHAVVVRLDGEGQTVDSLLSKAREQALQVQQAVQDVAVSRPFENSTQQVASVRCQPWIDVDARRCAGLTFEMQEPDGSGALTDDPAARTLASTAALIQLTRSWAVSKFEPPLLSLDIPIAALQAEGFANALIEQFAAAGLAADRVQLEIAETAFRNLPQHLAVFTRLRSRGFRLLLRGDGSQDISLHDFSACALDAYKLSPALVRTLVDGNLQGTTRRFISAILGAAQQLGAVVIATGVDTDAAVAALRLIGIRFMQGRALMPALQPEHVPPAYERTVSLRG